MRVLTVVFFFFVSALLLAFVGGSGNATNVTSSNSLSSIGLTKPLFEEMLKRRNDRACPARGFYKYESFVKAAAAFNEFGATGDLTTRKREVAAFMVQSSHETTGGSVLRPYTWGYCIVEEENKAESVYFGRGPLQLKGKAHYEKASKAKEIGVDLVSKLGLVCWTKV